MPWDPSKESKHKDTIPQAIPKIDSGRFSGIKDFNAKRTIIRFVFFPRLLAFCSKLEMVFREQM
jgi:hypothetical protein